MEADPVMEALEKMLGLVDKLRAQSIPIRYLDLGGGLGVSYRPADQTPAIGDFIRKVRARVEGKDLTLMVEPGRSIVGEAGVLVTRVLYRKQTARKEFVVVDAAMNDLIRPSLYQSHHEIIPLKKSSRGTIVADVVGPICETTDFLAHDRQMDNVLPGDLLAVCTAGAYGFVLASNYNSRPRSPEILVEGATWRTIRAREKFEDLIRGEQV
jgi:diaminopimelate decarboxylase